MEVYGKAVATIESTDEDKFGPNGGFTAVLSTPSLDRDGDSLQRDEWKDFTQTRYPLDIDHGMSVADTVGSFAPYWDGDRMMMDAAFASTAKAQDVRALVTPDENGIRHIGSVSVAFMVDKTKKSGEPQRELLNAGIVAIPSNRDAVILASKAASALKDAFSDNIEGEVPEEVKAAVLEALNGKADETPEDHGVKDEADTKDAEDAGKPKGIYVDIIPRLNEEALKGVFTELFGKAATTASGVGGDGALIQAIHDASSHLGAACPVIEVSDEGTGASSGANKSADEEEADTKDLEAFEKSLDEIITDDESPADDAAAASDEEPAPADDAAEEKSNKRERELQLMQMRAQM